MISGMSLALPIRDRLMLLWLLLPGSGFKEVQLSLARARAARACGSPVELVFVRLL